MMLMSLNTLSDMIPEDEGHVIGSVHDSGLFEIREDKAKKWAKKIKYVMENLPLKKKFGASIGIPIVADVTIGKHWGEGEELAA